MIIGLIVLGVICFSLMMIWDAHKESKSITIVSNWLKQHVNWTWVLFYSLTVLLAFSMVVYTVIQPPPTFPTPMKRGPSTQLHLYSIDKQGNEYLSETINVPGEFIEGSGGYIVDEKGLQSRYFWVGLLWFWPIYLIGKFQVGKWALKQKNRDLGWLWLTMLLLAITPLILNNKCSVSDLRHTCMSMERSREEGSN